MQAFTLPAHFLTHRLPHWSDMSINFMNAHAEHNFSLIIIRIKTFETKLRCPPRGETRPSFMIQSFEGPTLQPQGCLHDMPPCAAGPLQLLLLFEDIVRNPYYIPQTKWLIAWRTAWSKAWSHRDLDSLKDLTIKNIPVYTREQGP